MASRPLPPGRRGRGGRTMSAQYLPEIKLLNVEQEATPVTTASSYVEQLRVAASNDKAAVEPEHESSAQEEPEPAPVRSVKAFVATLERVEEPTVAATTSAIPTEDLKPQAAPTPEVVVPPVVVPPPAAESKPPVPLPVIQTEPSAPAVGEPPVLPAVYQPAPLPPVREVDAPPTAAPVAATPVAVAPVDVAPVAAAPVATAPAAAVPVVAATVSSPVEVPAVEGFHPFLLLLPVYSVPVVPEQVECVYDDEAVEMQKTIMKVIKKFLGKDRAKLEDFKINSRLYGNNFMDALEYLESLAKDLGGNRALQLVPCLLSIQPDFMKRNSLLVAARNYRMRNLVKLEATLDSEAAAVPEPVQPVAQAATPVVPTEVVTPVVASSAVIAPVVAAAVEATAPSIASSSADLPVVEHSIYESVEVEAAVDEQETKPVEEHKDAEAPSVQIDEHPIEQPAICEAEPPADLYVPPADEVAAEPTTSAEVVVAEQITTPESTEPEVLAVVDVPVVDTKPVEPSQLTTVDVTPVELEAAKPIEATEIQEPVWDEPKAAAALKPVAIEVSPIQLGTSQTSFVSAQAVSSPTPSENSSTSSAEADGLSLFQEVIKPAQPTPLRKQSTLNLFGEDIGDDDDDDEEDDDDARDPVKVAAPVAAPTPSAAAATVPSPSPPSTSSFFEAESLFGEVIPVKITAQPTLHAPVPAVVAPTPLPPPAAIRPQHSGMLFGFGTAGDDSDSDSDSDFSD